MRRIAAFVTVLTLAGGIGAAAQEPVKAPAADTKKASEKPLDTRRQILEELVALGVASAEEGVASPFRSTLGGGGRGLLIAYFIAAHSDRQGYAALLKALEARGQKQLGAVPNSKGSTSLAMKGLAPKILGLAVETGAVTRDVDGTSLTFRATPAGVIKALQNKGLIQMHTEYAGSTWQRYASRVSVAASFDASKGPSAPAFAADTHQLTNWSVRAEIVNQRDPAGYPTLWRDRLQAGAPYRAALKAVNDQLSGWAEYQNWETQLRDAAKRTVDDPLAADKNLSAAAGRFRSLLENALPRLEKLPNLHADALKALDAYVAQLTSLQSAIDDVYAFAAKGSLLTFDWSTARDTSLPDLYTATVVWEHALGAARKTDLTVNAALNFYKRRPEPGVDQFKSFDLTLQLQHPLGDLPLLPSATVALAARYSRLPNDTVAAAPAAEGTATSTGVGTALKGDIGVVQLKLTIPVKDSGIKVPLSITASNRTELIKEKDVRASFGLTFDLDSLVGGLFR